LVAHLNDIQGVIGSSPISSTIKKRVQREPSFFVRKFAQLAGIEPVYLKQRI
jgi:hypothetical protein